MATSSTFTAVSLGSLLLSKMLQPRIYISHMLPTAGVLQMAGVVWEVGTATTGKWIVGTLARDLVAKMVIVDVRYERMEQPSREIVRWKSFFCVLLRRSCSLCTLSTRSRPAFTTCLNNRCLRFFNIEFLLP